MVNFIQQFFRKRQLNSYQNQIISDAEKLNIPFEISYFLIKSLNINKKNELLESINMDVNGIFGHPYINDNNVCLICGQSNILNHIQVDSDKKLVNQLIKDIEQNPQSVKMNQNRIKYNQSIRSKINFSQLSNDKGQFSLFQLNNQQFEISQQINLNINEQNNDKQQCNICFNDNKQQFFHINQSSHQVCIDCLQNYLKYEIQQGKNHIKCPHCDITLSQDIIQKHLSTELYQKYLLLQSNYEIQINPKLMYCVNPKCGRVVKVNSKISAICLDCGEEMCVKCNNQLHLGLSCEQFMQNELQSWNLTKDVMKCPKCNILIEKAGGCNHIRCQFCRYQFCWICKSTYSSLHFENLNPFGCGGLMYYSEGRALKRTQTMFYKLYLWRFLQFLGFLILFPIIIILFWPWFLTIQIGRKIQNSQYNQKYNQIILVVALILIIIDPILVMVSLILLPFVLIGTIFHSFYQQYLINHYSDTIIQSRYFEQNQ